MKTIKLILFVAMIFIATSCFKVKSEQIEKVRIGMTKTELFKILPERGWNSCNNNVYQYGWNFWSPDGYKKTFWVDMKNDVVINTYTN